MEHVFAQYRLCRNPLYDCAAGQARSVTLTADETAARAAQQAQGASATQAQGAARAQRQADLAALKAAGQVCRRAGRLGALARLLGAL